MTRKSVLFVITITLQKKTLDIKHVYTMVVMIYDCHDCHAAVATVGKVIIEFVFPI